MELGTGFMGFPMPTMKSFNSKAEAIQFAKEYVKKLAQEKNINL